jgi:hypothetical protein
MSINEFKNIYNNSFTISESLLSKFHNNLSKDMIHLLNTLILEIKNNENNKINELILQIINNENNKNNKINELILQIKNNENNENNKINELILEIMKIIK